MESCQETVPEAITAFMEVKAFEDVICTAISLVGDCDTMTCIAGLIAEVYYSVPEVLKKECENRLPMEMLEILLEAIAMKLSGGKSYDDKSGYLCRRTERC